MLLERAYGILMAAETSGVQLGEVRQAHTYRHKDTHMHSHIHTHIHTQAPWNAVLTCAGRCGQLRRSFEILDQMQVW